MSKSIKDSIKEIKSTNDLMTVLSHYGVNYNQNGACCPFHNEKTPSFKINKENNEAYFKCFGCNESGDIINFIEKMEGLDTVQAVKKAYEILNKPCNLEPNSKISKIEKLKNYIKTNDFYKLEGYHIEDIFIYMLDQETPSFLKVKYRSNTDKSKKDMRTYKIIDQGEYFKTATKSIAGEYNHTIYNYPVVKNAIEKGFNVFFVEGEKDVESLKKLGYAATTIYSKKWNDKYTEQLQGARIVSIADTGQAGEEFQELVFENLKDVCKTLKFLELPGLAQMGDNKDVTDWLEQFDNDKEKKDMLNNVIKETNLMPLIEFGKYKYNGLYTYYLKPVKDDKSEEVRIYDGLLKIEHSHTDIDTKEEKLILSSSMYGRVAETGIKKGLLSKGSYAETINNQKGFLIESKRSSSVQDYLYTQYKYLIANDELRERMTTNKIGWVKYNNVNSFVYPRYDISLDNIIYHNEDTRFNNIFKSNGDFKKYVNEVIVQLLETEIGVISISAVVGSLLLEILNIHESFILDIHGKNGKGKTILLYALASIFGHPNRFVQEWNSTKTAIISNASELNNFPLMLDDTKKCDDKNIIAEIIYSLSGGKDRARANQDGSSKEQKTFKNITISTGETSLLNYIQGESSGAGAFGRVISIDTDSYNIFETKEQADKVADICKKNYGLFGVEFCKWLYEQSTDEENVNSWLETYNTYKDINYSKVEHHTSTRKANHIALLQLAYDLLDDFLQSKETHIYIKGTVFEDLLEVSEELSKEQDVYLNAYESFIQYCHTIQNRIHISSRDGSFPPPGVVGWLKDDMLHIFDKELIKQHLDQFGDFNDILKEWRKRGYIKTDTGKLQKSARTTYKIDTRTKVLKTYAIDTRYYNVDNTEAVSSKQNTFELVDNEEYDLVF